MNYDLIKKKRYYIYENIHKIKDHNQIINIIHINNCKYTENDNGIFLNLNTIEDKIINMIYNSIINTLNYKEEIIEVLDNNYYYEENNNSENLEKKEINYEIKESFNIIENDTFSQYNKQEQEIIKYTKKYNL
jgi:hypothetical protein